MIAFHFQNAVNDWPRAVAQLPGGVYNKAVDGVQLLAEAKQYAPHSKTVLRHWYDPLQVFGGGWNDNVQRARAFFATFIDGTFMQYARHVNAVEEWNEYHAQTHTPAEIAQRVLWAEAVAYVWSQEYRKRAGLEHIRLVLANTAVGNDIPFDYGEIAREHDCIMGYHAYVPVNAAYDTPHNIKPGEWEHYSGRWEMIDERWRSARIYVPWLITEFGCVGEEGDHLRPNDGWRMAYTYGGDAQKYTSMMGYWMSKAKQTAAYRNGRFLGATIFTTGGGSQWREFEVQQPEMDTIAQYVRDNAGAPPPPPPPPDPVDPLATAVWQYGQASGLCTANNDAALNAAIWRDGWDVGGAEGWHLINGVNVAIQAATKRDRPGILRYYYAEVGNWANVRYVEGLNE